MHRHCCCCNELVMFLSHNSYSSRQDRKPNSNTRKIPLWSYSLKFNKQKIFLIIFKKLIFIIVNFPTVFDQIYHTYFRKISWCSKNDALYFPVFLGLIISPVFICHLIGYWVKAFIFRILNHCLNQLYFGTWTAENNCNCIGKHFYYYR